MSNLASYTQAVRHTAGSRHLTYDGLKSILTDLGYEEYRLGTTPSHRVAFIHRESGHIIRLNRPESREHLSDYQLREIRAELESDPSDIYPESYDS